MKEFNTNINIIGGGLIGTATAISLSKLGFKITILEKNPLYNFKKNILDQRTVAISEGTKNFLEEIGMWYAIKPFSQKIKSIKVIDRKLTNNLEFDNERRKSSLGYIVKNNHLLSILYKKLREQKNVKILNNIKIINFDFYDDNIITETNGLKITSNLNIAADGKNSFVKKIFRTPHYYKDYKTTALVTTFTHSKDHKGIAYEFFYKNGPLAILPMQKHNKDFTSSIVWTNKNEYLRSLLSMENEKFKTILNLETQNSLGKIKKVLSKQLFPLSAHLNTRFFENRTIYIGDAAHSFHPIAGQGWNLGMNDVKNLFYLIKKYQFLGIEPGDKIFCKEYNKENYFNAYRLYQITDKLDSIFRIQNPIFNFARLSGINFIQKNKNIKNIISDFAMGVN